MAPGFFSKLVRPSSSHGHSRSSSTNSSPGHHPSISSTSSGKQNGSPAPRPQLAAGGQDDESDSGLNVTVIPPSPNASGANTPLSGPSPAQPSRELALEEGQASARGRIQSPSSEVSPAMPSPTPRTSPRFSSDDGVVTPTQATTSFAPAISPSVSSQSSQSIEDQGMKSQTGSTNSKGSVRSSNHPRAATVAEHTHLQTPKELRHATSNKSIRSKLSIMLPSRDATPQSSQASTRRDRSVSASYPPSPPAGFEDTTLVESPIGLSLSDDIPSIASAIPSSTTTASFGSTLNVPENSDAVSVRSVGSAASKGRRPWSRGSNNTNTSSTNPAASRSATLGLGPLSASGSAGKSPPRKNTASGGLASALAAGLAIANPGMTLSPIAPLPAETNSTAARGRSSYEKPRSRGTSFSYGASEISEVDSYRTGDGSDSDSSDESDELDLDPEDIPVTGFAVASNKRNLDFHELFPTVPEGDYLIEDYGCALQREILIQGRLYISENHVCFHANIFGWITDLSIPMYEVISLEKRMTAFVIPNAIQLSTRTAKYTFTSFLARDTTFDVLFNVWRLARPEDSTMESTLGSQHISPRGSLDHSDDKSIGASSGAINGVEKKVLPTISKITQCECGKSGQHYPEVAMEAVFPGTPEKIYNLMFTSGFMKDFMWENQKLLDIQISDWLPMENPQLLARNMTYIKPLNATIGPKQTRCELRDETKYCDFDSYVSMLTTTRTPEVPSGGVFSVKTRTCITWASDITSKVLVTTQVEWTGRSFIKGIIEKSCLDGQKTYHVDLEEAMRSYIHEHRAEFVPMGVDVAAVEESAAHVVEALATTPATPTRAQSELEARKEREHERNQRSLQWAYDTLEGTFKVARQSTEGALELIRDAWDQSSSTTILYFVIVFLVMSNLWTLTMMGNREEAGRRKEMRKMEEREKWVQSIVTGFWEEMLANRGAVGPVGATGLGGPVPPMSMSRPAGDWKEELVRITTQLDFIERRIHDIRDGLKELD